MSGQEFLHRASIRLLTDKSRMRQEHRGGTGWDLGSKEHFLEFGASILLVCWLQAFLHLRSSSVPGVTHKGLTKEECLTTLTLLSLL
jgi:hypothetical protein